MDLLDALKGGTVIVLTGDDGCGTTTLLEKLDERPDVALLEAPPGGEWERDDVVEQGLGPDHLVGREMGSMSSGERQRVRLARFLARTEAVLLLDEPFAYLDLRGIEDLLSVLRADGRRIAVVSKGNDYVIERADAVLVLEEGQLTWA